MNKKTKYWTEATRLPERFVEYVDRQVISVADDLVEDIFEEAGYNYWLYLTHGKGDRDNPSLYTGEDDRDELEEDAYERESKVIKWYLVEDDLYEKLKEEGETCFFEAELCNCFWGLSDKSAPSIYEVAVLKKIFENLDPLTFNKRYRVHKRLEQIKPYIDMTVCGCGSAADYCFKKRGNDFWILLTDDYGLRGIACHYTDSEREEAIKKRKSVIFWRIVSHELARELMAEGEICFYVYDLGIWFWGFSDQAARSIYEDEALNKIF